ncbi:family 10 glycosylhydrolase [Armatimonas sp.]|uniref:glycoside hydrolase family 10 protein n=1 Tax=Armatimonas sp. TaxID=1872638 RepID=UPI00286AD37D|nr:family 10 glycosylhydrolase [Armatimonas sp.]
MKRRDFLTLSAGAGAALVVTEKETYAQTLQTPPPIAREFRGLWVASVTNIDWPSKAGLPPEGQRAELIALLERAKRLKLNAVLLQVRTSCDALYRSEKEPWSEYLTGTMGQDPGWDPLAEAVKEAHDRGIELHAWVNPYRARQSGGKSPLAANHMSVKRPDLVKPYGNLQWLDPGEPDASKHSLDVLMDIVRRYDIDGLHVDDYFYPYKIWINEKDKIAKPFPDDPAWKRYVLSGGKLSRSDWRRKNIDDFIKSLYEQIKAEKPHVKFGISPFGIWRPGYPPQITGYDSYENLYGDSRKWMQEGWADYFAPQLYWKIDQPGQSFPILLLWWAEQNKKKRHLWPGLYTSKYPPLEIEYQIKVARGLSGTPSGHLHFSAVALRKGMEGDVNTMAGRLATLVYPEPALVPACPWLGSTPPSAPKGIRIRDGVISWQPVDNAFVYAVQWRTGDRWSTVILPGDHATHDTNALVEQAVVTAVDRLGNASV